MWPVLIAVALAVTRGRAAGARAAAWWRSCWRRRPASASSTRSLHTAADPAAAYFVTPTRAWELGAGALLALAPSFDRSPAAARAALSWVGLVAIAVAAVTYSAATPFPGAAALLPVLGALAVIRAGAPDLRWAPTRGDAARPGPAPRRHLLLGLPLALAADRPRAVRRRTPTAPACGSPILVLTLLLAGLTKRYVEDPRAHEPAADGASGGPDLRRRGRGDRGRARRHRRWRRRTLQGEVRAEALATERVLDSHPRCFGAAARDPRAGRARTRP